MDYHARNIIQDDVIRMPADGFAFRDMEEKWPHFIEEPCNLRIYLVTYGVNPFFTNEIHLRGVAYFWYQQ